MYSGPGSGSMLAAAAAWDGLAAELRSAAASYSSVISGLTAGWQGPSSAAMVPPPVIAANRSQLASLVATNLFGLNTSAIAATEAQYADMWAQDAAAMYGYAGSAAVATQLTPFTEPPQTTNPAGAGGQAAAAAQAVGSAPGGHAQSALTHLMSAVQQTLQSAAAPAAALPSSITTIAGAAESIGGIITGPGQASVLVTIL